MNKSITSVAVCASFASLLALSATQVAAQRGGGGRAGISTARMSSMNSRAVRSSASANVSRGPASTRPARGNINAGNRVNTGDINIHRGDVNIDVDHDYGYGWADWDYHPVAVGVAVGTAAAVATAWRLGAYYSALPTNCVIVYRGSVTYYQCGTYWYQPIYSGPTVRYVAVVAP